MKPFSKLFAFAFILAGSLFVPAAMASPMSGVLNEMGAHNALNAQMTPRTGDFNGLLKKARSRLRIGFGRRGHYYPRYYGSGRYGYRYRYPYYGYRRYYRPFYRYKRRSHRRRHGRRHRHHRRYRRH